MITVEIVGRFYNNHSLSIINRELALGLELQNGIDVFITPLDSPDPKYQLDRTVIKKLQALFEKQKTAKIPQIQFRHTYPPIWRYPVSKETRVVFIQPWEYANVPLEWQYKFSEFADGLVHFSKFTENVYLNAGLDPERLFLVPVGFNPQAFNFHNRKWKDDKNITRYIYVGSAGNSTQRKGADIMFSAWKYTFDKFNDVELIVKDNTDIYGQSSFLEDSLRLQYNGAAKITYISKQQSEHEMADLYRSCDFIVHPYRGEGYGMPVQEAMAAGCVPIVTAGGSTDDFVPNDYFAQGQFAPKILTRIVPGRDLALEPDINSLVERLSTSYELSINEKIVQTEVAKLKLPTWTDMCAQYAKICKAFAKDSRSPKRYR